MKKVRPLSFDATAYFNMALDYRDRLQAAEKIIGHILETAPWGGEEAHKQLLKEARAYFSSSSLSSPNLGSEQ